MAGLGEPVKQLEHCLALGLAVGVLAVGDVVVDLRLPHVQEREHVSERDPVSGVAAAGSA